jgi:hypothetical protein
MRQALFDYRCDEPAHQQRADAKNVSQPITIHEGRWAYCVAGAVDGHHWRSITPTALSDLHNSAQSGHAAIGK